MLQEGGMHNKKSPPVFFGHQPSSGQETTWGSRLAMEGRFEQEGSVTVSPYYIF
jgi:hypothetical protein